jgi:hypothetical protein
MEGLARIGFQRKSRRMDPHDHVGLLADRRGHTAAIAIAAVGHDDLPGVPAIPLEVFPAMTVCDAHLVHPAGQEVVGQMQPPVVPGATRLPEGTRVDQYEAARWTAYALS